MPCCGGSGPTNGVTAAALNARQSGETPSYQVTYPDGTKETFPTYLEAMKARAAAGGSVSQIR